MFITGRPFMSVDSLSTSKMHMAYSNWSQQDFHQAFGSASKTAGAMCITLDMGRTEMQA